LFKVNADDLHTNDLNLAATTLKVTCKISTKWTRALGKRAQLIRDLRVERVAGEGHTMGGGQDETLA